MTCIETGTCDIADLRCCVGEGEGFRLPLLAFLRFERMTATPPMCQPKQTTAGGDQPRQSSASDRSWDRCCWHDEEAIGTIARITDASKEPDPIASIHASERQPIDGEIWKARPDLWRSDIRRTKVRTKHRLRGEVQEEKALQNLVALTVRLVAVEANREVEIATKRIRKRRTKVDGVAREQTTEHII